LAHFVHDNLFHKYTRKRTSGIAGSTPRSNGSTPRRISADLPASARREGEGAGGQGRGGNRREENEGAGEKISRKFPPAKFTRGEKKLTLDCTTPVTDAYGVRGGGVGRRGGGGAGEVQGVGIKRGGWYGESGWGLRGS